MAVSLLVLLSLPPGEEPRRIVIEEMRPKTPMSGRAIRAPMEKEAALQMVQRERPSVLHDTMTWEEREVHRAKRREQMVLAATLFVSAVLLVPAGFLYVGRPFGGLDPYQWFHFFSLSLLMALGPYGFYVRLKARRVKQLEERFPDLLRDIAVGRRAGLTLTSAINVAARGDYGELTPDIKKMSDQLSWNVTFSEALILFGHRVRTPLVQRAVTLIDQASRSGGRVTDVILAAARDARETKMLDDDRRNAMSLYVTIIYITFFMFLGIVAVMQGTFIPQVLAASQAADGMAGVGGLTFSGVGAQEYRDFYFIAALVQGVGNGIVAGVVEHGRWSAGLVHAFTMASITYLVFAFLL